MKRNWIGLVLLLGFTGCQQFGQGTPGGAGYESGSGRDEGGTPYALGRVSPNQRGGMADMTIAASRAEGSLDVSGAGMSELSRRSAAATLESSGPTAESPALKPKRTADESLFERVDRTLRGAAAGPDGLASRLSAEALRNVRVTVRNGTVSLTGTAPTPEDKAAIEAALRDVEGVQNIDNRLDIRPLP
jgi:hypothetical protein